MPRIRASSLNPKAQLELLLRDLGFPPWQAEYRFLRPRQFRFDYAWPDLWLAVEYEGIFGGGRSRHTTPSGFSTDCEKYSWAALAGWQVIRITVLMLRDGRAEDLLRRAIQEGASC